MSPPGGEPRASASDAASTFERHRGRLVGLAYRMLGSRADAEDAVQDAWLRWQRTDHEQVEHAEAYLLRVVTRLCLDQLKSARAQREVYVGPWLPEPVSDADWLSPQSEVELADDLSFALLLALDRLSAGERAAFLLHDVFEQPFSTIASTLGRSEQACRQLAARARRAIRQERPVPTAAGDEHARLLEAFVEATSSGDTGRIEALLTADAVVFSDGGGRVLAALNPIRGKEKIARFLVGVTAKQARAGGTLRIERDTINGTPGLLVWVDERLDQAVTASVRDGVITTLYVVRNPEKLRTLAQSRRGVPP